MAIKVSMFIIMILAISCNFVSIINLFMESFVNKVAESGIVTLDLTQYLPDENTLMGFDLKSFLFREMILREKDFREALKVHDWQAYQAKHVYIYCSVDAIIPMWAHMLIAVYVQPVAASVFYGTQDEVQRHLLLQSIASLDLSEYTDKRVVIKGCADVHVPAEAYVAITAALLPKVKSLMYGEPCSTVPVFKKKNEPSI